MENGSRWKMAESFQNLEGAAATSRLWKNTTHWKRVSQSARASSKRYLLACLGAECFVAMCMLFSDKSDQLRIILGNCRIPLRLVRSLSQGPLGFQYGGRAFFKSLNKTFHEKCRMFRLPSGHCTPFIKMRNKPEFGVFSLQPSPRLRGGVGCAAIVYKKLCGIKLVVGKNLIRHEKKKKTIHFFAIIGFSPRKIKRTNYSYKLPPFLIKKPRKTTVSIKLGRCYPQNPSDMGIPFSYYLSELG